MAPSSHRSPSPLSSRPNPNPKTPEFNQNSNGRRSFSGNPFTTKPSSIVAHPRSFNPTTPANSPSDFGRRISVSKESAVSFQGDEQKENEKDLNVRVKSPAYSKGAKNFMSPTISAVSKFTATPRKKILEERNEQVRTSLSSSDGKSPSGFSNPNPWSVTDDLDSKPDVCLDRKKIETLSNSTITESDSNSHAFKRDASFCSKVPLSSQNSSDFDAVTADHKGANLKRESETIVPLDADPSLPPYDPKTNYLSPRPRFLHYKPNPRIEAYLNKESEGVSEGGRRLEDHFASEYFLDTESSEGTESESSQEEYKDVVSSIEFIEEGGVHLPRDAFESESVTMTDFADVSEVKSLNTHLFEGTKGRKSVHKGHSFMRSKSIPLVLILVVACLSISVTDSPIISYSTFKDQTSFLEHYQAPVAIFAKANPDGFMQTFQLWSIYYVSYFSRLVENLRKVDHVGSPCYGNSTALLEDIVFDKGTDGEAYDEIENAFKGGIPEDRVSLIEHEAERSEDEMGVALQSPEASEIESEVGAAEHHAKSGLYSKAYDEPIQMPQASENDNLVIHEEEQTAEVRGVPLVALQNSINFQVELIPTPHASEIDSEVFVVRGHQAKNCLNSKTNGDIDNAFQGQGIAEEQESLAVYEEHAGEILGVALQTSQNSVDSHDEHIPMPESAEFGSEVSRSAEPHARDDGNPVVDRTEEESIVSFEAQHLSSNSQDELILTQKAPEHHGENNFDSFSKIEPAEEYTNSELGNFQCLLTADAAAATLIKSNEKYSNAQKIMVAFLLVLLTPVAATAITYINQAKNTSKVAAAPTGQPLTTKKILSPKSLIDENTIQERLSNRDWQVESDMMGESCSSEMSSSYSKRGSKGGNEDQEYERKTRRNYKRESLASSSSEYSLISTSFGSFTTYEKISGKHGEEEIVTPVRRSSRIQNKVTSP